MVAIIDYDTGNLRSVENALRRLGAEYLLTAEEAVLRSADHVILPGVGEASSAMRKLAATGAAEIIPTLTRPVLGICIGMQLMCRRSEEGQTECLGIFPTEVVRLPAGAGVKVPHMGWDTVSLRGDDPLLDGLNGGTYLYYVHSYAARDCGAAIAVTDYGMPFSAALRSDNFYGTQFHPEKSGAAGERLLANFLSL
ncbi:MAG: imidazole glycerol phosphate synthase subunit HisH [Rikenellaceae bacterium]|nr:imidazole glycerol phosphate synthase subunit HisH [Rikenellaceae bacterium]